MKPDDWMNEIAVLIEKEEAKVEGVIREREKRISERTKKLNKIKEIIKYRLNYVKKLMNTYGSTDDERPIVTETEDIVRFEMPKLSEVYTQDLVYKIHVTNTDSTVHAYREEERDKTVLIGHTNENFDEFVKDTIKRFLLSWYNRKLNNELSKDREYKIKIVKKTFK